MKLSLDDILYIIADLHELDRTPECPSDVELAQYFAGVLPEEKSKKLAEHISQCKYCKEEIRIIEQLKQEQEKIPPEEFEKHRDEAKRIAQKIKEKIQKSINVRIEENIVKVVKESLFFKPVVDLQQFARYSAQPMYALITSPLNQIIRETEVAGTKIRMKVLVDERKRVIMELLFLKGDINPVEGVEVKIGKEQSYTSTSGKVSFELPTTGEYEIEITLPDKKTFEFSLFLTKH